jgi:hypothetical protein
VIDPPFTLPTPVIIKDTKAVIFTRLFSWLSACLLAGAVIVALISVTSERNDLRAQLGAQTEELTCRNAAAINVNRAVAARDNTIAEALIAYVNNDPEQKLDTLLDRLHDETDAVNEAIDDQELALAQCSNQ